MSETTNQETRTIVGAGFTIDLTSNPQFTVTPIAKIYPRETAGTFVTEEQGDSGEGKIVVSVGLIDLYLTRTQAGKIASRIVGIADPSGEIFPSPDHARLLTTLADVPRPDYPEGVDAALREWEHDGRL